MNADPNPGNGAVLVVDAITGENRDRMSRRWPERMARVPFCELRGLGHAVSWYKRPDADTIDTFEYFSS